MRKFQLALRLFLLFLLLGSFLPTFFHRKVRMPEENSGGSGPAEVLDIEDNEEALIWRLRLIRSAKQEIILATFDFGNDVSGRDLIAALEEAAGRGVRVRVLLDDLNRLRRQTWSAEMKYLSTCSGVEIRSYNPVNLFTPWKLNYRMHDKYLIVDGKACLLGGRNSNDLFLGSASPVQNIDRDVLAVPIRGAEGEDTFLDALLGYFDQIWDSGSCRVWKRRISRKRAEQVRENLAEVGQFEEHRSTVFCPDDPAELARSGFLYAEDVRLLTNGSEGSDKGGLILCEIERLLDADGDILAETPYIICDQAMYRAVENLARGRIFAVVTNAVESGANAFGCSDYLSSEKRIRRTGVEVYECIAPHSLHTKAYLLGEELSIVGSYNLDIRSTYLDTELMLAIRSPEFNRKIRENIREKETYARRKGQDGNVVWQGEHYENRRLDAGQKVKYGILRVLSPVIRTLL